MLLLETNAELGVAALAFGSSALDPEWLDYIRALDALNLEVRRGIRPVLMQLLHAPPITSATTRRELAALRQRIRPDVVNMVVSSSPLVRNAQTALDWLRKPHYASTSHATSAAALAHVAGYLPPSDAPRIAELARLVARVERRSLR